MTLQTSSLWRCSAAEIADLVRRAEVSVLEVVDAHLERIADVNPSLNAIVTLREDGARRDASAAQDALAEGAAGPLCGVPFTVKDTIATAGVRTTCGSHALAGWVPSQDATAVSRLKRAGAILLGKTNCPEFGLGVHTDSPLFGATRNPLGAVTPGGSSGGEAAALASGCSALGLGTDFGGSLRWPAQCTGVCALRPTVGTVPGTGAHLPALDGAEPALPDPLSLQGRLQVVGPLARTVADLRLALGVMAGPDDLDSAAVPVALDATAPTLSIAWSDGRDTFGVHAEMAAAVADAAQALSGLGSRVEPLAPAALAGASELYTRMREREDLRALRDARGVGPVIAQMIERARPAPRSELAALWAERDRLRARTLALLAGHRALVLPVSTEPPFAVPTADAALRWDVVAPSRAISLLGFPAVSVPWTRSAEGVPIAVQVVAPPFRDADALAVAATLERVSPWRREAA